MRLNDPLFPTSLTDPALSDSALGVVGGLVKLMSFQQIKNAVDSSITVENLLTSTSTTNALSANQGKALKAAIDAIPAPTTPVTVVDALNSNSTTSALSAAQGKVLNDALAGKLNTSAYNDHYKGTYASLVSLQAAHTTAALGDYALVDAGTGDNAHIYIWDAQEGWVQGGQTSLLNTDALPEGNTRLYFRNDRVKEAFTREDATFAAAALANNAVATNVINIASRYQLLHINTNHPCRVRLYASVAQRDADLTRPIGTDPTGNHGLLFEFISSSELLSADLSPLVDGFANSAAIPYSVTNLSGATQTITVTLNHVKTGAL